MSVSMREAIRLAIRDEMRRDDRVIVFGEDVARAGGVFKVTAGLLEEFGASRVRDTPIAESAIVGCAIGAAAMGLRPIAEIMFAEFLGVAMDQVVTELAKMRYLSRGSLPMPVVIRTAAGAGMGFGAQHSQTVESWLINTPGLVVASPSGPMSAYGLTRAAVRCDDPVILIEPRALYGIKEEFEPGDAAVGRLGVARVLRSGNDVTLVALGQMVPVALSAAQRVASSLSCEVVDLSTVVPWDRRTVFTSVARTGRLITVEENPYTGGWGTDVVSAVCSESGASLRAPAARVTCPDVPVPAGALEGSYLPGVEDVIAAIEATAVGERHVPRWRGWSAPQTTSRANAGPSRARRRALRDELGRYERLALVRAFEDRVDDLFSKGDVLGAVHTSQGQEAVAVGIAAATEPDDAVVCTYRGHGIALALGADPAVVLAEILGRRSGAVGGMGGSMHLVATEVGLLPTSAIVGAGLPIAAGAALAAQISSDGRVAIAVFGDGASNIGTFHEALNLAAVWKLPVVFVCENNLYAEYSPLAVTTAVEDIAVRATAYAIPGEVVDGMDVEAVRESVGRAVAQARAGGGPTLLEMKTYRYSGHSRGDPGKYRSPDEVARWRERDPLALAERRLRARGVPEAAIAGARARSDAAVADAMRVALLSPRPEPPEMFAHVRSTE